MIENEVNAEELSEEKTLSDNESVTDAAVEETENGEQDSSELNDGNDLPNYGEIAASDLKELKLSFPELKDVRDITELQNPMRYAALRDLGLTAEEAYLATNKPQRSYDNRAHLTPSVPGGASLSREMSRNDYDMAREIFSDLSDTEIRKLYRKVTK